MSPWKVILAAVVIFCSGLVTGAMLSSRPPLAVPKPEGTVRSNVPLSAVWHQQQKEFLRRMDKDLGLTPEQSEKVERILKESHERTKVIRERIAPEMKDELKKVREQIRSELSEEQRQKFEEAMKPKGRKEEKSDEPRRKKDPTRKDGTNATAAAVSGE